MSQILYKTVSRRELIAACGTLLITPLACKSAIAQTRPASPTSFGREPPKSIPSFGFTDEAGKPLGLDRWRGRGIILNLWATWCPPCVQEMPALDRLSRRLGDNGPVVLAISADHGGASVIKRFYAGHGITSLQVLCDPQAAVMEALGAEELPLTLAINAQGLEVGRHFGAIDWDAPGADDAARSLVS